MAVLIVYGVMVALILLGLDAIQAQGFFVSGYGYMFGLVSFIFWLITLIIALTKMTTYVASYQLTDMHIRMKVKAEKDRSALLGFFDFINTATYGSNPANFSNHRLGSQGSMKVSWRNIRTIRLIERHQTMILKGKLGEKMPIYFRQENQKIY